MTDDRVRERPILMSAPMVRAILAGTKTQTRRVVKPQPPEWAKFPQLVLGYPRSVGHGWGWTDRDFDADDLAHWPSYDKPMRCPYGQPGDRLWVRETFCAFDERTPENTGEVFYRADQDRDWAWTPSIHMPRCLSRITLEITEVRVERLQDISENDAMAEGVERVVVGDGWRRYCDEGMELAGVTPCETARWSYRTLWEQITGPGSWDANPWVWALTFRRLP